MKSTVIVYAIAVASLGLSSVTFAQHNEGRGPRAESRAQESYPSERYDKNDNHRRGPHRTDARADHYHDGRWDDRRFDYSDARRNDRRHDYYNARSPEFRRGGYIPREFRHRQYVVTDYRSYRLSPPPRGHQWVQVGADYVLIAMATGLIAHIVLNY